MPLLAIPKRKVANEKELINKVNSSKKSEPTLKLGKDSLLTVITNIRTLVDTKLSKYKNDYILINTEEELNSYINKILEKGICGLDTETTGLNVFKDKVVGASLYVPGSKPCYIPLRHRSYLTNELSNENMALDAFKRCFKRLSNKDLKIIYTNAKFDYKMIYTNFDIKLPIYFDTALAARAINNDEAANLKYQYAKYVENSNEFARFDDLFGKIPFDYIPIKCGAIYAAHDPKMSYELHLKQLEMLKKMPRVKWVLDNIEFPCIWATIEMEMNGVLIDQEYAKQLKEKYQKKLDESVKTAYKELNQYSIEIESYKRTHPNHKLSDPINLSSPTQLSILFYDIMKLPIVDKRFPRGTGSEILKKWNNNFCKALLDYRGNDKLMSTYIEAIPRQVEADGRIHCQYNQYGTDTGRYSSSEPNLQNIPSQNTDIRPMFTVPKGYCLVGSDFSQQEVRLMAAICGDTNLVQAYHNGKDIYAWVASMIYKVPYEDCLEFYLDENGNKTHETNKQGKLRRHNAKAIVLGINYSKGAKSIAEDLGITEREAQNIYNTFFKEFPKVKEFINETQAKVAKLGYSETFFGRRRQNPDMLLPDYEFKRNQAKPKNFDPTDFDKEDNLDYSISEQEKNYWISKLKKAFGFKAKQEVLELARQEGIEIKENTMKKADAERECVNSVIQGTAGDQTKLSLIALVNNQELKDLGFKIVLTIHDEILGECPIENAKRCGEILTYTMAHSLDKYLDMPFKCDAEFTDHWYGDSIDLPLF